MSFWERNLAFLAGRPDAPSRALGDQLARTGPAPDWGLRGREGIVLPGLVVGERPRALVSTFDAVREAERWADAVGTNAGSVAVFGGGGREAALALFRRGTRLALWVEPRLDVWRSLMTWQDWRIEGEWLPVLTEAQLTDALGRRYYPLWDGGFRTLEWRGAVSGFEPLWDGFRAAAAAALESAAADSSTQARFAERWYRNTLFNLRDLKSGAIDSREVRRAVVAGAGPGLDDALNDPSNQNWLDGRPGNGGWLLATDTALPALIRRGIVPDLALSLDGQLPTYHHFVPPGPPVPLVADIASLPLFGRLNRPLVRYLTPHPFSAVIRRHFEELPLLTAHGGHVSALAWNTAVALGARDVGAWGVDFAYRDGQAYSRGTYVYDLAHQRSRRTNPMETLLGASVYGAEGRERVTGDGHAVDTTPRLRAYRGVWPPAGQPRARLAHGEAAHRWTAFTEDWRRRLEALPLPPSGVTMTAFVRTLPDDVCQDWLALWPLATALFRRGVSDLPRAVIERALAVLQDVGSSMRNRDAPSSRR